MGRDTNTKNNQRVVTQLLAIGILQLEASDEDACEGKWRVIHSNFIPTSICYCYFHTLFVKTTHAPGNHSSNSDNFHPKFTILMHYSWSPTQNTPLSRAKTSLGILAGNWKPLPIHHLQNTASPTQWLNTKTGLSWNSPCPPYRSITQISVAGVCCLHRGIQPLTQVIYM